MAGGLEAARTGSVLYGEELVVIGTVIPEPSMLAPIAGGLLLLGRKRQSQV